MLGSADDNETFSVKPSVVIFLVDVGIRVAFLDAIRGILKLAALSTWQAWRDMHVYDHQSYIAI